MAIFLSIETSCDDTCVAVLDTTRVLSSVISSQIKLHSTHGGVVPNLAKWAHQQRIESVYNRAIDLACRYPGSSLSRHHPWENITALAVTIGPGLAPALSVGVEFAKNLALTHHRPLWPVNHVEGHLLSIFVNRPDLATTIPLPALALTVSGGHTKIVLVSAIGQYQQIGQTRDDAAGEALDKAAKLLGLGYPGGPVIERLALSGRSDFVTLPRPLSHQSTLDYSFSGLKTAFYYHLRHWPADKIAAHLPDLAASFQSAVFDSLILKYRQAIDVHQPRSLIAVGGVLKNRILRRQVRQLAHEYNLPVFFPAKYEFNTDNAAMIAVTAYLHSLNPSFSPVSDISSLDFSPQLEL